MGEAWCARCKAQTNAYLRRKVLMDGSMVIFEVCLIKGTPHRLEKAGRNVAHALVVRKGLNLGDIPLVSNDAVIGCEVQGCTEVGVQFHHWAPRAIFGEEEASHWPFSLLCRTHHAEWHKRTGVALGKKEEEKKYED